MRATVGRSVSGELAVIRWAAITPEREKLKMLDQALMFEHGKS